MAVSLVSGSLAMSNLRTGNWSSLRRVLKARQLVNKFHRPSAPRRLRRRVVGAGVPVKACG